MNVARLTAIICVFLTATCVLAQQSLTAQKFAVYPGYPGPRQQTETLRSSEKQVGKVLYQVFRQRGQPNQELFRVPIGRYFGQELVRLWNCGIVAEADFNGDGKPDYVWYGGDDTSESIVLFLSSGEQYQRTDIIKTAAAAWEQRFQKHAPDLAGLDGQYEVRSVLLEWLSNELNLDIVVGRRFEGVKQRTLLFRIAQRDFKE